jgi:hypothetical protein
VSSDSTIVQPTLRDSRVAVLAVATLTRWRDNRFGCTAHALELCRRERPPFSFLQVTPMGANELDNNGLGRYGICQLTQLSPTRMKGKKTPMKAPGLLGLSRASHANRSSWSGFDLCRVVAIFCA